MLKARVGSSLSRISFLASPDGWKDTVT